MRAPLLFEQEPTDYERYLRGLEVEQAFSVKPNAGQTWTIHKANGEKVDVKIVAIANTSPKAKVEPLVVFRNKDRQLHTRPLKYWANEKTLLKVEV